YCCLPQGAGWEPRPLAAVGRQATRGCSRRPPPTGLPTTGLPHGAMALDPIATAATVDASIGVVPHRSAARAICQQGSPVTSRWASPPIGDREDPRATGGSARGQTQELSGPSRLTDVA